MSWSLNQSTFGIVPKTGTVLGSRQAQEILDFIEIFTYHPVTFKAKVTKL